MGRVFSTTTAQPTSTPSGGGRVFNSSDNPLVEPLRNNKAWEQMSVGDKIWGVAEEIPKTLYNFLPEATRQGMESKTTSLPEFAKGTVKGAGQFYQGLAQMIAQAVGGAVLGVKQRVTKKPEEISIPLLGDVSSYQVQTSELEKQGFSPNEARALVGINAYLGMMPFVSKLAKTKTAGRVFKGVTTKEESFAKTPEGIKAEIKTGVPIDKTVRIERPIITEAKRIIGKTEEQKQFHKMLQGHTEKFFEGRAELLSIEEPLNKALSALSDKELANYSKFTQGFPIAEVTPKLKSAVDMWKTVSKAEQDYLVSKGKLTLEQIENRRWKPVEAITGRSRNELKEMGVEPQYYPYLAEDLLKKSDFIAATGRRTKGGYLKRFTGKMLQQDSYIKDPKIAIPRHRLQVFRDKMNSELVDNIKDNFAETDKIIIKQLKENPRLADMLGLEEWKPAGTLRFYSTETAKGKKAIAVSKKVESYWIPKDVAKELNQIFKPGTFEKVLRKTYDPAIDMWRVSVLGMVPRWLYNNTVGNIILSIMGKTDPFAFGKSAKEMFARTKFGKGIQQREISKGVFAKEYAGGEMAKAGQLGGLAREQTQFLRPIENWLNLLEQAKNYKALRIPAIATQNLIKGWIALGKPIGFLNKVTENWFRGAMYISKTEGKFLGFQLDKPVPPAEGIKYVNEFLFDYSNLSRFERATFRRALPFWNWQKNITKFAFTFPLRYPTRGLIVGALLQDYVDYINEVNQKEDKTKSILRIKTDMTYENKPLYLNIKSAIPFSDVFRTIPTNFETFGRFLTSNPVSKIIIERAFRINSFTGQPFSQPKEMQQFDEYGKPILPLPTLREHIGKQFPQIDIGRDIADTLQYGKPIKRYETGEPKIYRGQVQTSDIVIEVLKYFGISLSPIEINKIKQQVEKKGRLQDIKEKRYKRQIESGLKRLKVIQ